MKLSTSRNSQPAGLRTCTKHLFFLFVILLTWNQPNETRATAGLDTYNWYIDGSTRAVQIRHVQCIDIQGMMKCSAPMPSLVPGPHTIVLTQEYNGVESPKSAPLNFTYTVTVP